jgi:transposase
MQITAIGLDIAKNVFQVHGIDAAENVVVRKQLRRGQVLKFFEALAPCLIGMDACATAHNWARELRKLGHRVRLMPTKDVKAYVKRNKNDAADAEAIREAVRRPTMRFVEVKSERARAYDWDRSVDHIRASSHNGCIQRPHTWLHPNVFAKRSDSFPLHRGRRKLS